MIDVPDDGDVKEADDDDDDDDDDCDCRKGNMRGGHIARYTRMESCKRLMMMTTMIIVTIDSDVRDG